MNEIETGRIMIARLMYELTELQVTFERQAESIETLELELSDASVTKEFYRAMIGRQAAELARLKKFVRHINDHIFHACELGPNEIQDYAAALGIIEYCGLNEDGSSEFCYAPWMEEKTECNKDV